MLFTNVMVNELIFKSGGEEGAIAWSAAPTSVEQQRENLTERLKREFGLFLSDDEEERARKHGTYFKQYIYVRERIYCNLGEDKTNFRKIKKS